MATKPATPHLFERVRDILESARSNIARTVNSETLSRNLEAMITSFTGPTVVVLENELRRELRYLVPLDVKPKRTRKS